MLVKMLLFQIILEYGILKKFKQENSIPVSKKHEKEVTMMQRNTLLEPNNFIPQWEAGGEEQKEVS